MPAWQLTLGRDGDGDGYWFVLSTSPIERDVTSFVAAASYRVGCVVYLMMSSATTNCDRGCRARIRTRSCSIVG